MAREGTRDGTFAQLLDSVRGGMLRHDLDDKVRELVRQVEETGKKGKIALELTINPAGQGRVEIGSQIKTSAPVPTTESALFYITESGELSRRDPRQLSLPELRTVEGGA